MQILIYSDRACTGTLIKAQKTGNQVQYNNIFAWSLQADWQTSNNKSNDELFFPLSPLLQMQLL
jgi:hypothetical protein